MTWSSGIMGYRLSDDNITVYKLTRQKMFGLCAYLIPERNRTERRQEEGKNSVYLFVFLHELGRNKCFINHFLLSDETFWL
jgi:hypothetical protein